VELTEGTAYYVRTYASNIKGTAYGEEVKVLVESPYYVKLPITGIMVQKEDINTDLGTVGTIKSLCGNSTLSGYTNWRLPTKDELAILYNERNVIGGFHTASNDSPNYWSSTVPFDSNPTVYCVQNFSNGEQGYHNTITSFDIQRGRCVRTLP
jgi:hypothetical protein